LMLLGLCCFMPALTCSAARVVYVFFLKNKGPNWLDGTRTHP
jgi:hypothetical protein